MQNVSRLKSWWWWHKWTSLVCLLFALLLCITGLPLIFAHEIDEWLNPLPAQSPDAEQATASVDAILASARALRPDEVIQFLVADPDDPGVWFVRMGHSLYTADISSFLTFDAYTGEFLRASPLEGGFMNLMTRLHVDLFLGLPGTLFLGAMGLILLASIVTGIVLYGPFMKRLAFGSVRQGRGKRVKWLDIHNLTGVTTLAWLTVVAVTGVVNTLSIPIFSNWQGTELAAMVQPYKSDAPPPDSRCVDCVLASLEQHAPDKVLSFMAFPGNDFASDRHFVAFMAGETPLTSKLLNPVLLTPDSGTVLDERNLPWDVSALLLSQPLHFGDYGGLPLKILWALLDVLAILVLYSGLVLWLRRPRPAHVAETSLQVSEPQPR